MKRFLLFCFNNYSPAGGMNDFKGDFDTIDEAKANRKDDLCHIFDLEKKRIVYRAKYRRFHGSFRGDTTLDRWEEIN